MWWRERRNGRSARALEGTLKRHYGEPPVPREPYKGCVNGGRLMHRLIDAAGKDLWAAGYVEVVFTIGEKLSLLFKPRLRPLWERVGIPPGPWADLLASRIRME